jgi:DNA (cytosine-5)-methyltransferase 1
MTAYYNEHDEFAAAWLRNLIAAGLIADGEVDTRSIVDVCPRDLRGFAQCHFFAGIGGWSYALRKAGWDDNCPTWTGSCPCQPFSLAGAQRRFDDERHLWPIWRELVRECSPAIVFGEQVASATEWLGLVRGDLEAMGYAVGAMPIQAAGAGADHLRDRYWFVAHSDDARSQGWGLLPERAGQRAAGADGLADASSAVSPRREHDSTRGQPGSADDRFADEDFDWVVGADGKARRVKSGICLLAHGVPNRVGLLRGFGNAIDHRPAAAFIAAARESLAFSSHQQGTENG